MFAKTAVIALAAGAQVSFAAPVAYEERSLKAVGTALVGGAASLITGSLLNNKRSEPSGVMVDTETGTIYMDVADANEERSLKAVGTAIAGGIASGVAGAAVSGFLNNRSLSAIENFFKNLKRDVPETRSLSAIENFFKNLKRDEPEARSLSAIENFFKNLKRDNDLDARSLSAIENFFKNLKREEPEARSLSAIENFFKNLKRSEPSGVMVDTETGTLYMDIPDANEGRSLKAVGTAIAGGIASGVAGAAVSGFLNNKRAEPSGLMIDTETGTLYMDVPEANDERSLKAVGTALAGGIASGVAGAAISGFLNNKRAEPSGLMIDTDTGVLYMDVADSNEERSLKAVGTAIAGGIASGAAGAIVKDILNKRDSGLMVDTETGVLYMDVPDATEARSLKAVGTAIAGGIASGAAGAVVKDILNKRDSGLMVDTETGVLYMDVPDANEERSLKAVGTAIAGGIASGAAGAVVKDILNKRDSGVMVDTETGTIYMDVADATEARSLKAVGTAIAGGIASGAAGAIVKDVLDNRSLSAIENFFKNLKREEPEARSLSAIENFFKNLKRSELEESMAKRSINDLE